MGLGCLPTSLFSLGHVIPWFSLAPGPRSARATHCRFEHAGQIFGSLTEAPRHPPSYSRIGMEDRRGDERARRDPGADHELMIERVCAIDVAKASGTVCTRLPHQACKGGRPVRTSFP